MYENVGIKISCSILCSILRVFLLSLGARLPSTFPALTLRQKPGNIKMNALLYSGPPLPEGGSVPGPPVDA